MEVDVWVDTVLNNDDTVTMRKRKKQDTMQELEAKQSHWHDIMTKMQKRYREMSDYAWIMDTQLREHGPHNNEDDEDEEDEKPDLQVVVPSSPNNSTSQSPSSAPEDQNIQLGSDGPVSMYDRMAEGRKRQSSQNARQRILGESSEDDHGYRAQSSQLEDSDTSETGADQQRKSSRKRSKRRRR
jgi:hypothetical protein